MEKTWNQLFVRHGWLLTEREENIFDCTSETDGNLDFLMKSLDSAQVDYSLFDSELILYSETITEEKWIDAVDYEDRGRGEGLWFRSGIDQPKVAELDTYISAVIRQLNRLGFHTMGSCDGHERRPAHVIVTKERDIEQLSGLLLALGDTKRIYWREQRKSYHVSLHLDRLELLALAEKLNLIKEDWIGHGPDFIKEKLFQHQVEDLLMIPGSSGNEGKVRNYVAEKLLPLVDHLTIDRAGNILAEKTCRSGIGPVILLNAHLDTVFEIERDREIIKVNNIWSSSNGILGADDRAGVAVLLHIAEHLNKSSSFSGKVKFIFTVEEECGLVGASQVDEYFLWNTDAAIVVDRRGTGDIVTSCGGFIPFCLPGYGTFFENVAGEEGLNGWRTTPGGSSDTRIWASHGIQSVNLSTGYSNEHTAKEYLDVESCYRTAKLIEGIFKRGKELKSVLREIRREEKTKELLREAR
jgi:tripeptide aminopeptidase